MKKVMMILLVSLISLSIFTSCSDDSTNPSESGNYLYPVSDQNLNWGFINNEGELKISYQYDFANVFDDTFIPASGEPLAAIEMNEKVGYVNKSGELKINPQFESGHMFYEGMAKIKMNELYGFIDKSGLIKIYPIYDWAYHFSEGLCYVEDENTVKFIDKSGKTVISNPQFRSSGWEFSEGLAAVKINDKWGYR